MVMGNTDMCLPPSKYSLTVFCLPSTHPKYRPTTTDRPSMTTNVAYSTIQFIPSMAAALKTMGQDRAQAVRRIVSPGGRRTRALGSPARYGWRARGVTQTCCVRFLWDVGHVHRLSYYSYRAVISRPFLLGVIGVIVWTRAKHRVQGVPRRFTHRDISWNNKG